MSNEPRKAEKVASTGGAIAGTVPCAFVGAVIGGLGGNKLGSEIDRARK